ncbi:hypothetical protein [Alcanivorax sp. DG881]|jgi:hypothetical protein|uniref:hypothetical protein n=1 Tax=Alcanivorax sp. DG881 TaxID=236097 RepID=UPI00017EC567|nr:hypothetical protein [Alcanivorax sp. DG881]EDX89080.1 hypothetical protein ADG881_1182 [Alcanivorax sp. DG881]
MSNNKETAKHALLKELDDVQSLLDDADTPTQPPLLKPSAEDTTAPDSQRIRQLASERANPFLSGRPAPSTSPAQPAPSVPTPAPQTAAPRPTLTNRDIDAAIDELVAEALPKLEKALRLKLRAALRRKT